jgi:hypothetical protein
MRVRRIIRWVGARGSLRTLSRWLFLATLIVAPWLYGGTTAASIELIDGMLAATLAFWVASLLVDHRWPAIPPALVVIAGLILLQGWWMVVNAHAIYDSAFESFVFLHPLAPNLAGSADYVLSYAWMVRATLLLGIICLVADLAQRPHWLLRLWYTVAISGGLIALLGLLQKASGARMIFWQPPTAPPMETFFGTFFYHANAGAFLNLLLPVVAGLAIWAMAKYKRPTARTIPAIIALISVLAIVANTSRMAQVVGAAIGISVMVLVVRPTARQIARVDKPTLMFTIAIVALTIFAVAQASHLDEPWKRWQQFKKQLPIDERWVANRVAFGAIAEAGAFGFGPGVFRAAFRHYQAVPGSNLHGTWRFLHDDYLQTIFEWGWVGAMLMGALVLGGLAIGTWNYFRNDGWSNRQEVLLSCVLLALIGVAIHAAVDFPLQILSIQLLVATYLGVCWSTGRWKMPR